MAGIFKANNPTNNILLVIYAVAIRAAGFLNYSTPVRDIGDAALYRGTLSFLDYLSQSISWIYPFVTLVLVLLQAFYINRIANSLKLFPKSNYLAGISYILLSSIVPNWYHFNAPLLATTIIIWVFSEVVKLQLHSQIKGRLFNIGMGVGTCLFIFPPALVFVLIIFAGLALFKAFRFNEWLIVIVGLLLPVYFFYSWQFLYFGEITNRFPNLIAHLPVKNLNNVKLTIILAFLVHAVLGFIFSQQNLRKQLVQTRNAWKLSYFYIVLASVVFFLTTSFNEFDQIFVAAPLSLLAAAMHFYLPKKWMSNILHILMLIFAIYIGYFYVN